MRSRDKYKKWASARRKDWGTRWRWSPLDRVLAWLEINRTAWGVKRARGEKIRKEMSVLKIIVLMKFVKLWMRLMVRTWPDPKQRERRWTTIFWITDYDKRINHLFFTNFSFTELGMLRSTSNTFATNISITLSLFCEKSFSIFFISSAVSFSREASNSLSSFFIRTNLLFLSAFRIRLLFAAYTCWLPAQQLPWLPSAFFVFVMLNAYLSFWALEMISLAACSALRSSSI